MNQIYLFILFFFIIFLTLIILYKSYSIHKITTPEQALEELIQGNKTYNSFWNFKRKANRKSVACVQRPFGIVLSCSDSRVPTEIIFNQLNLGNLFIVRNAGNVIDGAALGSIEYGVEQLGAVLIIVLGHEKCGAVTATVDSVLAGNPEQHGHIKTIINSIQPAAEIILKKHTITTTSIPENLKSIIINEAVQENIRHVIENLHKQSDIIRKAAENHTIKIVGAYYNLEDGNVQFFN